MFFFKKKETSKKITPIPIDIHAHLIPNIDDGPKTMSEALDLIRGLKDLGYHTLTATPHVYSQYYNNSTKSIKAQFILLKKAVEHAQVDVKLHCAAEYYLEKPFKKLLATGALLTLGDNRVLVETSTLSKDSNLFEYIFDIQMKGFQPILAHPERYGYLSEKEYIKLVEHGCEFQLNLLSLAGYYGGTALKRAKLLLKKELIHFIGSDVHNQQQLQALNKFVHSGKTIKLLHKKSFNNHQIFQEHGSII
ncbi:MAG: tyrosine-protein phosphatase [Saprospiraceae bacterium]